MSIRHFPSIKPSAIAIGTIFTHVTSLAILGPMFGETYQRAISADSKEEYADAKEAASVAATWGTSILGSVIQSYGIGALINATDTRNFDGAAYLGGLIFMATSASSFITRVITEKRPLNIVVVGAIARAFETVGLSIFLSWWGTRTNPFE